MTSDADDERVIGEDLERLVPVADVGWSARLGEELEREGLRRGVAARPSHLWLRAIAAGAVGAALLLVGLAQA